VKLFSTSLGLILSENSGIVATPPILDVENLIRAHEVQLVNYLNALNKEIGLLINFGPTGVKVKRKCRQPKRTT